MYIYIYIYIWSIWRVATIDVVSPAMHLNKILRNSVSPIIAAEQMHRA